MGATLAVLVAGCAITLWSGGQLREAETERIEGNARHAAERLRDALKGSLDDQMEALRLAVAFFEASEQVSGAEWRHFSGSMDPARRPGFHAMGLILGASPSQGAELRSLIQREQGGSGEIRFARGDQHWIVVYREPREPKWHQLGADLAADPTFAKALQRTLLSHQTTMAVVDLELLPELAATRAEPGVVLFQSIGKSEWTTLPGGWRGSDASLFIALRLAPLVAPLLADNQEFSGLRMREARPDGRILFDTRLGSGSIERVLDLNYLGESWLLEFEDRHDPAQLFGSRMLLGAGLLLALLLASYIWHLLTQRERARGEARRMNREVLARGEQLRRQEAYLQRLVDKLPTPVVVKSGKDRCILIGNRAYAEMLGRPDQDLVGRQSGSLMPPGMAQRIGSDEDALLGGQAVGDQEVEFRAADGAMRSFLVHRTLIDGPDGDPRIVAVYPEITTIRRQDQALRESEMRWRFALDGTGDGVWDLDLIHGRIYRSPRWFGMLDFPQDENWQPEAAWIAAIHPDDRARTVELLAELRAGATETYTNEYRLRDGNGQWRWVLARGKLMERDATGRPYRVLGTTSDMAERKRAEWALRESEARFRRIADTAPVLIWMSSPSGEVTYVNKTWSQFTGRRVDEALGDGALAVVHPDDRSRVSWGQGQGARDRAVHAEFRMRRGDGEYRWIMSRGEPRFDELGNLVGYIGTCFDITDQKRAEQELRAHSEQLSAMVREQTRDLVVARDQAEAANAAKSQFLANMSHELRTPLHAIMSYAKLGQGKAERMPLERLKEYFERIHASGNRLLHLLNDLLDLSKLEAGKMVMEFKVLDLVQVAREAAGEFEALYHARQLTLRVEWAQDTPRGLGDANRIGQVVRNLLSNAAKFSPEGRTVSLRLAPARLASRQEGRWVPAVRLVVEDEGIGIPEAELEAVFDKFVQSSKTRSGAGGTGLGLAICREIVLAHRGSIRAFNRPEGGACFEMVLPAPDEPGREFSQTLSGSRWLDGWIREAQE
ncbi:MAG: PAS domain-containing protein [Rhodocyclaceae bacterium]|nr:PAS domain-containing protein [Rhodocyclaceae bacterium]